MEHDSPPDALQPARPATPAPTRPPNTALALTEPRLPAEIATELDAHGLNPADYHWVPVLRKPRADGWSPDRQRKFIAALADTGSVATAATETGMTRRSAYALRRAPGSENFAAAWDAAIRQASLMLTDIAFERAIEGVEEVEYGPDGLPKGPPRVRYNDRLLMFLMRAHNPAQYRDADRRTVRPGDMAAVSGPSLPQALALLEPEAPAAPHLLTLHDDPVGAIQCADILDGALPSYHRDPEIVAIDPAPDALGLHFERRLEAENVDAARRRIRLG